MSFFETVYEIVKQIPRGKVMSYGQIARAAGFPRKAREVGWALHVNPDPEHIPCHRVVNREGRVSPAFVARICKRPSSKRRAWNLMKTGW